LAGEKRKKLINVMNGFVINQQPTKMGKKLLNACRLFLCVLLVFLLPSHQESGGSGKKVSRDCSAVDNTKTE
jgi:hypothetical protein